MPTFRTLRNDLREIEREFDKVATLIDLTKTEGGHLSNFGDDLVMLCRKHGIQQSIVAGALAVTPTSISRRYTRAVSSKKLSGIAKPAV